MGERDKLEGYEKVCHVGEVPSQMPYTGRVGDRGVLICRHDEGFYAVDELCPHKNRSMRFGVIFDGELICPHHQYRFDLETGRCNRRCAPVQTYPLEVVGEEIWVRRGG